MQNRSKDLMRMDRRLLERPGWITPEEVEKELASLPDVEDKIDQREDEPTGEGDAAPAAGSEAQPPAATPVLPATGVDGGGEFGGGGAPPSSL